MDNLNHTDRLKQDYESGDKNYNHNELKQMLFKKREMMYNKIAASKGRPSHVRSNSMFK